jgi:hypothetical protein
MKKWSLLIVVFAVLGAVLLGGCGNYVAQEDFAKVKSDLAATNTNLATVQSQVKVLSAQSAYGIWWDQYYNIGTAYRVYVFADVATFNKKLGALIEATGDSATQTAWKAYLAADTALNDIVKSYPTDYTKWTTDQTKKWTDASTARYTALGKVGTTLFNAVNK